MPFLALPISVFESLKDTDPLGAELAWPGDLDEWCEVADKEAPPLWSPVTYREGGQRVKNQTERSIATVNALVLDYDRGVSIEAAREAWGGFEHAGYTSWGHLYLKLPKYDGSPRFRLVLPFARALTTQEFRAVWAWAHGFAAERGVPFDPLPDPGRIYFVPSHRPGHAAERFYWYNTSPDLLDPDVILGIVGFASAPAVGIFSPSPSLAPVAALASSAGATGGGGGLFAGVEHAHQTEDLGRIEAQCAWMRHCREDAGALPEPEWYAWLSVVVRCRDGNELAHQIGSAHPGYTRVETEDKLRRALADTGPATCSRVRALSTACAGCPLGQPVGATTSPVQLGRPDPATASPEEVREDAARRVASATERAKADVERLTRSVADAIVDEARQRALAAHARQYGTPDTVAEEAGKLADAKARLRDEKAALKEAERALADAEKQAKQAKKLDKADPRVLNDPLFALDIKTGIPRSSLGNVTLILERDELYASGAFFGGGGESETPACFRYNLFDGQLYYGAELAEDHVDTTVNIDIERRYGFASRTLLVQEAIVRIAHDHAFHPVRDYLDGLEWDGTDRLDDLLRLGFGAHGDTAYVSEAGRKFAVGMVARVYRPGVKNDTMLVLTGKQGIGKSSGLAALVGAQWFSDSALPMESKDAYMQLVGRWLYEVGELDSFRRVENTRIKLFLSSQEDNYRPPFGRHAIKRPRQTVFVGTTNEPEFLNDPTGSRRFVPVAVSAVDTAWLAEHRDQLWAEAVVRFRRGEPWHYAGESAARLARESAPYQQDDPWEPLVHEWLVKRRLPTCTVIDALTGAVGVGVQNIGKSEKHRMTVVLRALHCEDYRPEGEERADGSVYRPRMFRVPEDVYASNVTALPRPGAFAGSAS